MLIQAKKAFQTHYNLHSMEHRHKIEVVINHDRKILKFPLLSSYGELAIGLKGKPMICLALNILVTDLRRILCPDDGERVAFA
ncbi:MAG: hypothetical protein Ct9H90mP20_1920 [Candidatus Neomarinimicrobiota bacterium]|nr:MAG: hypothetical protein Ct9H90mP20_1920 [Candidatus Neomarinimicrobiota bacterium]